jgi:hypothetical protein
MKRILLPALALSISCLSTPAHAATITFNSEPGGFIPAGSSQTVEGFDFQVDNGTSAFGAFSLQGDLINNGTRNLFLANHSLLTLSQNGGGSFDLIGFDLAGSWVDPGLWSRWASSVDVTGFFSAGGSITTNISLPGTAIFETKNLIGFTGLSSVVFAPRINGGSSSQFDYEFTLDNIVVADSSVPEPATLLLLGAGLAAAAARRRSTRA